MSDERNDATELEDTILGTALSRAIEAQPVRETPFEASRAMTHRSGTSRLAFVWPALAAAALVLALALGAVLAGRRPAENAVASQPILTTPPAATAQPSASAVAVPPVPVVVYFAREGLPPVAATILGHGGPSDTVDHRILSRIGDLTSAQRSDTPSGTRNALVDLQTPSSRRSTVTSVRVDGDTATIDLTFDPPLAPRSADDVRAFVQQIVYTATEEPGIQRVRITTNDGKPMVLGTFPVDTGAMTRMDVAGYTVDGLTGTFKFDGTSAPSQLSTSYAVDTVAPGLARFTIAVAGLPARTAPSFTLTAYDQTHMAGANAELEILIPNGSDATTAAAQVDRSPLRSIAIGSPVTFPAKVYRLGLDHLWPWRAVVLFDPTRIVIDIGGAPSAISADQNEAVYAPAPSSEIGRTFTISGAARAFEATIRYRVKDSAQKTVVEGFAKATIGTSPIWGGYDTTVTLPASVSGNVTLEVFEVSMKDGTEVSKVTIPLRVR